MTEDRHNPLQAQLSAQFQVAQVARRFCLHWALFAVVVTGKAASTAGRLTARAACILQIIRQRTD